MGLRYCGHWGWSLGRTPSADLYVQRKLWKHHKASKVGNNRRQRRQQYSAFNKIVCAIEQGLWARPSGTTAEMVIKELLLQHGLGGSLLSKKLSKKKISS
ncbi:hypothetical protein JCM10296v2_005000 [Rhodotorula toruloides]